MDNNKIQQLLEEEALLDAKIAELENFISNLTDENKIINTVLFAEKLANECIGTVFNKLGADNIDFGSVYAKEDKRWFFFNRKDAEIKVTKEAIDFIEKKFAEEGIVNLKREE